MDVLDGAKRKIGYVRGSRTSAEDGCKSSTEKAIKSGQQ